MKYREEKKNYVKDCGPIQIGKYDLCSMAEASHTYS